MKHKGIIATLLSLSIAAPLPTMASSDLPQIGTAGLSVLSLEKEESLGELYTYQLRSQAPMVLDPLVTEYVQALGHKLVAHADNVNYPFDFMVLQVNDLNAFAYFGGHVAIFTGIITEADSEDELASVMAHEIAHVTQRHLARKMEQSKENLPLTLAGIAASILVGIANPEAGMAGLQASIAANQQFSTNYTRSNEAEADRVGFRTLYKAGFDPRAMADFFDKLVAKYRFVRKPPEFLLDHPLTESRVAEARDRAFQYPKVNNPPSLDFALVKMLIRANYGDEPEKVRARLENELKKKDYAFEEAVRYGIALTDLQLDKNEEALATAEALIKKAPHNLFYKVLKVDSLIGLNRAEEAAHFIEPEAEIRPNSPVVALNLANAWIHAEKGEEAIKVLEPFLYIHPEDPLGMDMMVQAQALAKHNGAREAWQAEQMAYHGAFDRAITYFNRAYQAYGDNVIEQRRIEGRIAQLKAKKARLEALR
ncbi:M48 family metalloprotease [Gallaecimonas kandeliae]|uniref:beta-barrel assembly-enhancing protease n=1 Tax=Gallaecimonas kandeliae TaxID=3029055 RepID=UPI00264A3EB3|nr:M48 family metalloprotease [Gallaecimonas kandeliae]WKE66883.1 M48 family metalloprotease [Gallaecimonas kandeliae]